MKVNLQLFFRFWTLNERFRPFATILSPEKLRNGHLERSETIRKLQSETISTFTVTLQKRKNNWTQI